MSEKKSDYHVKKFPNIICMRLSDEQVQKLGKNRSATVRSLIDNNETISQQEESDNRGAE